MKVKYTLPKIPVKNAVKSDVKIEKEKGSNNQNNNENNISENNVDENNKKSKQEEKIPVKKLK